MKRLRSKSDGFFGFFHGWALFATVRVRFLVSEDLGFFGGGRFQSDPPLLVTRLLLSVCEPWKVLHIRFVVRVVELAV